MMTVRWLDERSNGGTREALAQRQGPACSWRAPQHSPARPPRRGRSVRPPRPPRRPLARPCSDSLAPTPLDALAASIRHDWRSGLPPLCSRLTHKTRFDIKPLSQAHSTCNPTRTFSRRPTRASHLAPHVLSILPLARSQLPSDPFTLTALLPLIPSGCRSVSKNPSIT